MPRVKKRESEDQGDTSSAKRKPKNGSRGRNSASYMDAADEIPDALIEQIVSYCINNENVFVRIHTMIMSVIHLRCNVISQMLP